MPTISSLSEYNAEVNKIKTKWAYEDGEDFSPWFRGQASVNYSLLPGLYRGMMDGSMIYTRDEKGWKEMKVGRIFAGQSCIPIQKNRNEILQSLYICHYGGHEAFLEKMDWHISPYKNKVCIGDGAKWVTFDQDTLQNTSQAQTNIDDAPAGIGLRSSDRDVRLTVARHVADARDADADVRIGQIREVDVEEIGIPLLPQIVERDVHAGVVGGQ